MYCDYRGEWIVQVFICYEINLKKTHFGSKSLDKRFHLIYLRAPCLNFNSVFINRLNQPDAKPVSLSEEAEKFISDEKGVHSVQEALQGASDILAEVLSEKAECRALVREFILQNGVFVSKIKDEFPEGTKCEPF